MERRDRKPLSDSVQGAFFRSGEQIAQTMIPGVEKDHPAMGEIVINFTAGLIRKGRLSLTDRPIDQGEKGDNVGLWNRWLRRTRW